MFHSFFPRPRLFFLSGAIYAAVMTVLWYLAGGALRGWIGLGETTPANDPVIGLGHFTTDEFLFFYLYIIVTVGGFAYAWSLLAPHKWQVWSVLGTAAILFSTYFSVEVSVAINNWRRPFFDAVQNALDPNSAVEVAAGDLYGLIWIFAQIALVWMVVYVLTRFFVSHWVFRWRTAMNDYYMSCWPRLRKIEGAAQRVQEDTMRFADITENLGVAFIESIMTLIAFLPILWSLSSYVSELPIVGEIPAPLFQASIFWSIFGTFLLAIVGIKLPGLYFRNQRVEAAYRKELVYGEDDARRAQPMTVAELYSHVRTNYFRLYFHYMYFNVFRGLYIQADNIFVYVILVPTIVAGGITFGILQQILTAFGQVSNSFQFLVNSWPTIVELMSIHKRLMAFEKAIDEQPLDEIEQEAAPAPAE